MTNAANRLKKSSCFKEIATSSATVRALFEASSLQALASDVRRRAATLRAFDLQWQRALLRSHQSLRSARFAWGLLEGNRQLHRNEECRSGLPGLQQRSCRWRQENRKQGGLQQPQRQQQRTAICRTRRWSQRLGSPSDSRESELSQLPQLGQWRRRSQRQRLLSCHGGESI